MKPDQKFFVFDCESVGLYGQTFAVAGGIYNRRGDELHTFAFHCDQDSANSEGAYRSREDEDRAWIKEHVTTHPASAKQHAPHNLRHAFWTEWTKAKADFPGILMFVECGYPVEARFVRATMTDYVSRVWEGPYPMHEIATLMLAAGMDPMATYERQSNELPAHEPLADARLSARLLVEALDLLAAQADKAWRYDELG